MSRIIAAVALEEFRALLDKEIVLSPHALEHLSLGQRKVFKPADLLTALRNERPAGIGRQRNGRVVAYYRRQRGYLKLILEAKTDSMEIVTFMVTRTIPRITT